MCARTVLEDLLVHLHYLFCQAPQDSRTQRVYDSCIDIHKILEDLLINLHKLFCQMTQDSCFQRVHA